MPPKIEILCYNYIYFKKKGGDVSMPGILVKPHQSFEEAYRLFKKQVDRNLIVTEARARRFYEKPAERRKKEKIAARKKLLKRLYMLRRYEARL